MENIVGKSLGRYQIIEPLGEGGMASVYKAYDTRLERHVAVKVIHPNQQQSEQFLKRFEREAKALAKLTHTNIVHVNDYGEQDGIPYLVMDYLPGGTLKQKLGKPMYYLDALHIIIPIAQALQYAHENGIIHRDVKPANILMTQTGSPMLSDFGIAKLVGAETNTQLTSSGMSIGTPDYMAPEQWTSKVVPQSDIYSLGIVLYQLVTGRRPYIADTPGELLIKQVTEPLPLPRSFVPNLPEAMDRVLLKALAKEPTDRYATAAEFASALEQLAREAEIDRKAEERAVQLTEQRRSKEQKLAQESPAATLSGGLNEVRTINQPPPPITGGQVAALPGQKAQPAQPVPGVQHPPVPEAVQPSGKVAGQPVQPAQPVQAVRKRKSPLLLWLAGIGGVVVIGIFFLVVILFSLSRAVKTTNTRHITETANAAAVLNTPPPNETMNPQIKITLGGITILGSPVATAEQVVTMEGTAEASPTMATVPITVENAASVGQLASSGMGVGSAIAYSPDGKLTGISSSLGIYIINNNQAANQVYLLESDSWITSLAFSPDSTMVAGGAVDGTLRVWQVSDGKVRILRGHKDQVLCVAFSPDGKTIASGSADRMVLLWQVSDGSSISLEGHTDAVYSVAFSPDGNEVASASADKTARVWKTNGDLVDTLTGHDSAVSSVVFSPTNGNLIATASWDGTVRIWRTNGATGERMHVLKNYSDYVNSVAFSGDGALLAAGSNDGTVTVWRAPFIVKPLQTLESDSAVISVAFLPKSSVVTALLLSDTLKVWRTENGELAQSTELGGEGIAQLAYSRDGSILATVSEHNIAHLYQLSDKKTLLTLKDVASLAFSPDGNILAVGLTDQTIQLLSLPSGEVQHTLQGHTDYASSLAFSPDGTLLVSGSGDKTVRLWKVSDGTLVQTLEGHTDGVTSVAFSPNGRLIASAASDNSVRIWQVSDGKPLQILTGHAGIVNSVAFSSDGEKIVTGSADGTIRLWQVADGQQLWASPEQGSEILCVAFSVDGKIIAAGGWNYTLSLWQSSDGKLLQTLTGHNSAITSVLFAPYDIAILSASADGTVRFWGIKTQ